MLDNTALLVAQKELEAQEQTFKEAHEKLTDLKVMVVTASNTLVIYANNLKDVKRVLSIYPRSKRSEIATATKLINVTELRVSISNGFNARKFNVRFHTENFDIPCFVFSDSANQINFFGERIKNNI